MMRHPFFRELDGCWYAQVRQGGKRKQVKLRDPATTRSAFSTTRRPPDEPARCFCFQSSLQVTE